MSDFLILLEANVIHVAVEQWKNVNGLSHSGINWFAGAYNGTDLSIVVHSGGFFPYAEKSSDGINWFNVTSQIENRPFTGISVGINQFGAEIWIAISRHNIDFEVFAWSSNKGVNWNHSGTPVSAGKWTSIAYGIQRWMAVCWTSATSARIITSTNGITWTNSGAHPVSDYYDVAFGNGTWVVISTGGEKIIYSHDDGITWTEASKPGSAEWESVAFGNDIFVIFSSDDPVVMTSPNGEDWTIRTIGLPIGISWYRVRFGKGIFVAVGDNISAVSQDGIIWSLVGQSGAFSVFYGNDRFISLSTSPKYNDFRDLILRANRLLAIESGNFTYEGQNATLIYSNGPQGIVTATITKKKPEINVVSMQPNVNIEQIKPVINFITKKPVVSIDSKKPNVLIK